MKGFTPPMRPELGGREIRMSRSFNSLQLIQTGRQATGEHLDK